METVLENIWFLAIVGLSVLFAPFWAALIVAHRPSKRLEHRNVFVLVCATFCYGVVSMLGLLSPIFQFITMFVGANSSGAIFRFSESLLLYGSGVVILALVILSVWVPLRVSRSWASLVAAWR